MDCLQARIQCRYSGANASRCYVYEHPIVVIVTNLYVQQQLPLPTRHVAKILLSIVMAKHLNALMDCLDSTITYEGAKPFSLLRRFKRNE